jgi:CRP-like cAMP-binding protein/rhodanese-related sulfurtransferase
MTVDHEKEHHTFGSLLFEDIPQEKMNELMNAAESMTVPANTFICRQGDPGDKFYIIKSGKIRIFRRDDEGLDVDLSEMGPGEGFGEMALLTGQPRSANVQAIEETQLTVIAKDKFDQILKDYPGISVKFISQMSSWLLRDEARLQEEKRLRAGKPDVSWVDFAIVIAVSLAFAVIFNSSNPNGIKLFPDMLFSKDVQETEPRAEMVRHESATYILIDARPTVFFNERHIKGAINMPYAMFDLMYLMLSEKIDSAEKIIVTGHTISGRYDQLAAQKLIMNGYENVYVLKGGLRAWVKKGLPTEP